jgi:acetylglutamate kinase
VVTRPLVIKLGGRALDRPGALAELATALTGRPAVIVHGGGNEVSAWSERLGLVPRFEGGRRVTDAATLEVVAAVLAGLVNKRLVAGLRGHGLDAIGLSALDGIADVARVPGLGEVGRVESIDAALLEALLARGATPVVASLAQAGGGLLNVNADDLAAALAPALGAEALVLLSDAPGLVLGGAVVPQVANGEIDALLASPEVTGGMAPKLEAARAATRSGACEAAYIASWNGPGTLTALLAGSGIGTRIAEGVAHD